MVGLAGVGERYPAELSVECVRVSLQAQLCLTPTTPKTRQKFYYEPTAGLDPIASTVIEDLIRHLQCTRGVCSYAIVTHQESTHPPHR